VSVTQQLHNCFSAGTDAGRPHARRWYTPCASQSPTQGPPSCYVEHKIEHVLGRIKKLQPNATGILYYNSMFNFNFYHLNGMMEEAESKGIHTFLRDETGRVIELCNDGDEYCNITTFVRRAIAQ
jgi:hypothetical protein